MTTRADRGFCPLTGDVISRPPAQDRTHAETGARPLAAAPHARCHDARTAGRGHRLRLGSWAQPAGGLPVRRRGDGDGGPQGPVELLARATIDNKAGLLKPEMFARLQLEVGEAAQFIAVPREAVLEVDGKQFVYVVNDPDRYMKREVKISNISPDQVRIIEGLTPGERIVTKGAVLIKGQEIKGL